MGGRGASSASAGNGSGGIAGVEKRMGELSETMLENSRFIGIPVGVERSSMERAYRRAQREYQQLQGKRSELGRKSHTKPQTSSTPHTKLNGYGEATSRNVTSLSYERSKRRRNKDIDKWFGRGM